MLALEDRRLESYDYISGPNNEVKLVVTCEACPTQIEGYVYGKQIYFRERHGAWAFYAFEKGEEFYDKSPAVTGTCEEFMPVDDALKLVKKLIKPLSK